MIRAIDREFSFPMGFSTALDHVRFGVTGGSELGDNSTMQLVDDAEAMLDYGKLSPRNITPKCSVWWLIGRKKNCQHKRTPYMTTMRQLT